MSSNRLGKFEKHLVGPLILAAALSGPAGCNGKKTKTLEARQVEMLQQKIRSAVADNQKLARKNELLMRLNKLLAGKTSLEWFDDLTLDEARWLFEFAYGSEKAFDFKKEELDAEVTAMFYGPLVDTSKLSLYQWWYLKNKIARERSASDEEPETGAPPMDELTIQGAREMIKAKETKESKETKETNDGK